MQVVIYHDWLVEWIKELKARPAAWAGDSRMREVLDAITHPGDVTQHQLQALMTMLPGREALRFRSMAAATFASTTTTVTSLDPEYIAHTVEHTLERVRAQMEGRWRPEGAGEDEVGGGVVWGWGRRGQGGMMLRFGVVEKVPGGGVVQVAVGKAGTRLGAWGLVACVSGVSRRLWGEEHGAVMLKWVETSVGSSIEGSSCP